MEIFVHFDTFGTAFPNNANQQNVIANGKNVHPRKLKPQMKTKKLILQFIISFLLSTITVLGQTSSNKIEEVPYIEVAGISELEVIPDEIYIGIIIRERYVNKEKITIEEQEAMLLKALKQIGLDLTNLFLSDANSNYVRIRWQKNDVLTKKEYSLKVSNATEVSQVLNELEKIEINEAFISKVNHSKIDSLKKEVRIQAIRSAKEKADYLLKEIGEETGKPIVISENKLNNYAGGIEMELKSLPGVVGSNDYQTKMKAEDTYLQFQKIKLVSNIYVKFSIK